MGRLSLAVVASALVVLGSPYVGQLRGAVQEALPAYYLLIVGSIVGIPLAAAVAAGLWRIRERRGLRFTLLGAAVVVGVIYARLTATGDASVDAVERFHFVEYGVVTLLFYRVWHRRSDPVTILAPLFAGLVTGTADEMLQWFVPIRVGEWHDVALNGAAVGCGLLFAMGLHKPPGPLRALDRTGRFTLAALACTTVLACASFVDAVHMGHEIRDPEIGTFLSQFTADDLRQAAADRAVRWRETPPTTLRRLSREDQYLAEGLWHVQARNNDRDGAFPQWRENRILEAYFGPVLEFPSCASPAVAGWTWEQRAAMAAAAGGDDRPFISRAQPLPIYAWNATLFWAGVIVVNIAIAAWGVRRR